MARLRRRSPHRSTRRLSSVGGRGTFKKIWLPILLALAVIVGALVWGNILKARSDKIAADEEAGRWYLDTDVTTPVVHTSVPTLRSGYASPGGNMRRLEDEAYRGATLHLGSCTSPLPYRVGASEEMALTYEGGAPSLSNHVKTLQANGLYVIGVFEITSFDTSDPSLRAYRRGLEMTLLSLFAKAGIDDILLTGLPMGTDAADQAAVTYLREIRNTLATLPISPPALGVTLSPPALQGDIDPDTGDPVYVGSLTPGRMLSVCDYLALDMIGHGSMADGILQGIQYAYVRYELRLLMSTREASLVYATSAHGFERILEYGG